MTPLEAIEVLEGGNDSDERVVEAVQYLVDTGLAWQLQGFYGRTAEAFIEAGYVNPRRIH